MLRLKSLSRAGALAPKGRTTTTDQARWARREGDATIEDDRSKASWGRSIRVKVLRKFGIPNRDITCGRAATPGWDHDSSTDTIESLFLAQSSDPWYTGPACPQTSFILCQKSVRLYAGGRAVSHSTV